jgi:hypothetical protein
MLVATLARTASEHRQLAIDAAAALDFVKQGPRKQPILLSFAGNMTQNPVARLKGQAERSGAPFQQLSTNILACM